MRLSSTVGGEGIVRVAAHMNQTLPSPPTKTSPLGRAQSSASTTIRSPLAKVIASPFSGFTRTP